MSDTVMYTRVGLDPGDAHRRSTVRDLLDRCGVHDQRPPLGDHALAALISGEQTAFAVGMVDRSSRLVGYAQATPSSQRPPVWTVDIAIDPGVRHDDSALDSTLGAIVADVCARGGSGVQWWCHEPSHTHCSIAERHGLFPTRQLLEMHVDVRTITEPPSLAIGPFVPGVDDEALLEVNSLAFANHPDQGDWTLGSLTARFASDWFDPAGLLVHRDDNGTVVGFCWTKIHRSPPHVTGEIYVVAVRPTASGRGLGHALTHAGLVSLHHRGIDRAMLFVDSANASALRVYRRLGFTVTSNTTALVRTLGPTASQRPPGSVPPPARAPRT